MEEDQTGRRACFACGGQWFVRGVFHEIGRTSSQNQPLICRNQYVSTCPAIFIHLPLPLPEELQHTRNHFLATSPPSSSPSQDSCTIGSVGIGETIHQVPAYVVVGRLRLPSVATTFVSCTSPCLVDSFQHHASICTYSWHFWSVYRKRSVYA